MGIGIAIVGLSLFGGRVVQKSFLAATPRLAVRMPIIRQGPHARHPFLQWVDRALNRSDRLLVTWNGGHTWNRTPAVEVAGGGIENGTFWNTTQVQGFYALNARDAFGYAMGSTALSTVVVRG